MIEHLSRKDISRYMNKYINSRRTSDVGGIPRQGLGVVIPPRGSVGSEERKKVRKNESKKGNLGILNQMGRRICCCL